MTNNGIVVGIPAHDSGKFIGDLLLSLCSQTDAEFSVMVACDRCSDNTREVVDGFKGRLNLWSWDVDFGKPGRARQSILDAVPPHSFVYFVDSDDLVTPRCVSLCKEATRAASFEDVRVMLGMEVTTMDGESRPQMIDSEDGGRDVYCCGSLYSVDGLRGAGIRFSERLVYDEDADFNEQIRAYCLHLNDFFQQLKTDEVAYKQRMNSESMTRRLTQGRAFNLEPPIMFSDSWLRWLDGKPKGSNYYYLYTLNVLKDLYEIYAYQRGNPQTVPFEVFKRRVQTSLYSKEELLRMVEAVDDESFKKFVPPLLNECWMNYGKAI